MKLSHVPLRLAAGAFILNSGLEKSSAGAEQADMLHGFAKGPYPFVGDLEPKQFADLLSKGEMALGAGLLLPIVPSGLIGLALTAFASSLVGLYLKTPGLRKEGSLAPTQQGIAIAKDTWLLAIGLALVFDSFGRRRHR
ncbi:MAG: hypothetical protein WAM30_09005 [Candidatus Dormiibacterota bacterium]